MDYTFEDIELQGKLTDLKILYKTRGGTCLTGKQRVFISYDSKDITLIQDVCEDILSIVDCAILYSEKGNTAFETVVESGCKIDLLIMCITSNYLQRRLVKPEEEISYAKAHGIPVLPLLLENNVEAEYQSALPKIQYIKKFNNDPTAIPYRKKLTDYIASVLISDEMYQKIQVAFDAFIFLSYRKKDRKYAQELMHLIHSNPFCKEVAIWYDEYLVPGEDFSEALRKMIRDSNLFAMVITPSLLEKDNYIMREEYPLASSIGKDILPVSMVETNEQHIKQYYTGITKIVNGQNSELTESLKEKLSKIVSKQSDENLNHTFFIGLAYLYGIYMEENKETGLSMISDAATKGLPEAARKMAQLYRFGQGVNKDISSAIEWQHKYCKLLEALYSDVNNDDIRYLIEAITELAEMELECNRIKEARNSCWKALYLCAPLGRGHYYSELRIPYHAKLYMLLGDVFLSREDEKQAVECYSNAFTTYMKLSEANSNDWDILNNTCRCFFKLDSLQIHYSSWYTDRILNYLNILVKTHYDAETFLMLAKLYRNLGEFGGIEKNDFLERAVSICLELTEKHKTSDTFSALVETYIELSDRSLFNNNLEKSEYYVQKAIETSQKSILICKAITGYIDYIECCLQKNKILNKQLQANPQESDSQELNNKMNVLFRETMQILKVLDEQFPGSMSDFIAFRITAAFSDNCSSEYIYTTYLKALESVRKNPKLYFNQYISLKHELWTSGALDSRAYQNFIEFEVKDSNIHQNSIEVFNKIMDYPIIIDMYGCYPSGKILSVKISEDVLLGIKSEFSANEYAYRSCHCIQICEPNINEMDNCTPDEHVFLTIETNEHLTEEIEYNRCYG